MNEQIGDRDLEQTVAELARGARTGDAAAFEELIRRYERVALSVAYSVLGNAADAGDAVQEGFLRAWQRLGDLQDPEKFGPWVCNIVRNRSLDVRRRGKHVRSSGVAENESGDTGPHLRYADDPSDQLQAREERERVGQALASLDEQTRTAVVMRYYDGRSSKEIGAVLGLNPAAVDMRLSRAQAGNSKDVLLADGVDRAGVNKV